MAVGEAITNLAAAPVGSLAEVKLSANWMAAAGHPGEDALLFDAVRAVGMELCPALGVCIPVGKDSLSMQAQWQADGDAQQVGVAGVAGRQRVRARRRRARAADAGARRATRFGAVADRPGRRASSASAACDLGAGATARLRRRLAPDLDDPAAAARFFELIQAARADGLLLAYHDRSDGGAFAALCEMAFASHLGLDLGLDGWGDDAVPHAVQRGARRDRAGRRPRTAPPSPTWSTATA